MTLDGNELHRKLFRRVRKHKGETWKPDQRIQPNSELGVWCPQCRSQHSWRNARTLKVAYEKTAAGGWRILWTCAKTGEVLKMEDLVRSNINQEE